MATQRLGMSHHATNYDILSLTANAEIQPPLQRLNDSTVRPYEQGKDDLNAFGENQRLLAQLLTKLSLPLEQSKQRQQINKQVSQHQLTQANTQVIKLHKLEIASQKKLNGVEVGQWAQRSISQLLGLGGWKAMKPRIVMEFGSQFINEHERPLSQWWKRQSSVKANTANKQTCERNRAKVESIADVPIDLATGIKINASFTQKLEGLGKRIHREEIKPLYKQVKSASKAANKALTKVMEASEFCGCKYQTSVPVVDGQLIDLKAEVSTWVRESFGAEYKSLNELKHKVDIQIQDSIKLMETIAQKTEASLLQFSNTLSKAAKRTKRASLTLKKDEEVEQETVNARKEMFATYQQKVVERQKINTAIHKSIRTANRVFAPTFKNEHEVDIDSEQIQ